MYYSPLRYPGGKRRLAKFIALVCEGNKINGHYVEPYAGGAGVALHLLLNDHVSEITINDYDYSVYSFWYSVLHHTERLCKAIEEVEVNVATWKKQKEVQRRKKMASRFDLGFSTFFLNRTNVSGVLDGGIIGGLNQVGKYKIDCRFNKMDLVDRIRKIAKYKKRIHLYNLDAVELVRSIQKAAKDDPVIFYFDPPYYLKGASLYLNHYDHNDHVLVGEMIKNIRNARWIVSYDDTPEVREIYRRCKHREYELYHTAHITKKGKELMYFSSNLRVPKVVLL